MTFNKITGQGLGNRKRVYKNPVISAQIPRPEVGCELGSTAAPLAPARPPTSVTGQGLRYGFTEGAWFRVFRNFGFVLVNVTVRGSSFRDRLCSLGEKTRGLDLRFARAALQSSALWLRPLALPSDAAALSCRWLR